MILIICTIIIITIRIIIIIIKKKIGCNPDCTCNLDWVQGVWTTFVNYCVKFGWCLLDLEHSFTMNLISEVGGIIQYIYLHVSWPLACVIVKFMFQFKNNC